MGNSLGLRCVQTRCDDRCDVDEEHDMDVDEDETILSDMFEPQAVAQQAPFERSEEARGLKVRPFMHPQSSPPVNGNMQNLTTIYNSYSGLSAATAQPHHQLVMVPAMQALQGSPGLTRSTSMVVLRQTSQPQPLAQPASVTVMPARAEVNGNDTAAARNVSRQHREQTDFHIGDEAGDPDMLYKQNRKDGRGTTGILKTKEVKEHLLRLESMKAIPTSAQKVLSAEALHRRKD
eukprot:TRINITY_DN5323_c0_g1_i1.p1 TRINITY_DN5323_c0_g1~~TRINITY_DN5323_c0_g1_i1.p1  ORF type:complete len:234 (+),score=42.11 TRINITY_DN5323_c0_g1_i1:135-836(+)